jgi:hypothetical protein
VDPSDRRRVILEAIPGRAAEVEAVFEPIAARMAELFRRYSAEEVAVLLDYFTRATPTLHEAAGATRKLARRRRRGAGTEPADRHRSGGGGA